MTAFTLLGRRIVAAAGSVFSRSHHKEPTRRRLVPASIAGFLAATAGNFGIIFGISLFPVIGATALALDYSKLMRDRGAVQNSLDAAAFATAKYYTTGATNAELLQYASDFFEANLPGFVDESDVTLQPRIDEQTTTSAAGSTYTDRSVTLTATLNRETFLATVTGLSTVSMDAVSSAKIVGNKSVEIALVIDNSGSMSGNRMDLAKSAAADLVDIVSNDATNDLVKFALVPFAGMVNIGTDHQPWIDIRGFATYHNEYLDWDTYIHPANIQEWFKGNRGTHYTYREKVDGSWRFKTRFDIFEMLDVEWAGCVEMRPWPHNTLDTHQRGNDNFNKIQAGWLGGAGLDALFVPYFAPAEPDFDVATELSAGTGVTHFHDSINYPNDYLYDWMRPKADNPSELEQIHEDTPFASPYDVTVTGTRQILRQNWIWRYQAAELDDGLIQMSDTAGTAAGGGPNAGCFSRPITPLTADKTEIFSAIDEMASQGNINIQHGLAWGWRLLSSREPFTEGRDETDGENRKIAILLTAGGNVFGANVPGANETTYGAWGYGKDGRIEAGLADADRPELYRGRTLSSLEDKMNVHTLQTCENARADGVTVFTIALDVATGSSVKELLEACGGSGVIDGNELYESGTYYYDVTSSNLSDAMSDIANQVLDMRFTE